MFITFRTNSGVDMKLELVIKLDKRNTAMSKKFHVDFMPANYDAIVIFLIYGHVGAKDGGFWTSGL